jgi:hypothetical protein
MTGLAESGLLAHLANGSLTVVFALQFVIYALQLL